MKPTRLGAVGYLNTRPLVEGLSSEPGRFSIRFDVPSVCATLLHAAAVDVAVIPSIEFLRGDYRVVAGVAIGSLGDVASVAMFSRVPVERVRSVALDTSSRTSATLLRILCKERFGIAPRFEPRGPELGAMLAECDAALLIGDPALYTDHEALGLLKVDLGGEWTAHTGLPFVWAFWAGRAAALDPDTCVRLQAARDRGVARLDGIAGEYADGDESRERVARHYLRHQMRYDLGEPHRRALLRFYASAASLGLVPAAREPEFAAAEAVSTPGAAGTGEA